MASTLRFRTASERSETRRQNVHSETGTVSFRRLKFAIIPANFSETVIVPMETWQLFKEYDVPGTLEVRMDTKRISRNSFWFLMEKTLNFGTV